MSPERREDEQRRQSAYSVVARRAGGLCEAQVSGVCSGGHDETHHRLPRSASSVRTVARHDPVLLLAVCSACHAWIESNRNLAYEAGLLVRRGPLSRTTAR